MNVFAQPYGSTSMFSTVGVQSSGILAGDRSISLELLVVPLSPGGTGHLVNQFAEPAAKLRIENIFDAVRALTHNRVKFV
jgi:hypothetical protein